jgi:hypothetical protein
VPLLLLLRWYTNDGQDATVDEAELAELQQLLSKYGKERTA